MTKRNYSHSAINIWMVPREEREEEGYFENIFNKNCVSWLIFWAYQSLGQFCVCPLNPKDSHRKTSLSLSLSLSLSVKSTKQIVSGFQRLYFHQISSKSIPPIPNPHPLYKRAYSTEFPPRPTSQNGIISRFLHQNHKISTQKTLFPPGFSNSRRLVYTRNFSAGKINAGLGKSLIKDPLSKVKLGISQYREAVGLQVESFWKRNYLVLVGAGGVLVCIALWRVMFGVASTFVGLSEGMAKYGFLALAAAMVSFGVSISLSCFCYVNCWIIYLHCIERLSALR